MLGKHFRPLDFYSGGPENAYKLLPFHFIRLQGTRYVVTNMVGEYIVIGQEDLYEFSNHRLSPTSDLYNELKSKHFLIDSDSEVPVDLLTLKLRTKLLPQSNFTSLHLFVVTLRCDYSCPYCQVSRQTEDKESFDMSERTAFAALDITFRSPAPAIKIEFQGGEPLLNFELIRKIVIEAKRRNECEQRDLEFVIATNLSLLSGEIISFCLEHDVYLSTSLDGPKALHDKNRPKPGRNGHLLTVQGIKLAQKLMGKDSVSALMTTTEQSLSQYKEIINEYVSLGFTSIFLRPLSPYGFAITTRQSEKYNTDQWLTFFKKGLDYIIEINKQGYFLKETYTVIILRKMLTPFSAGYVDLQSPAGAGIAAVVYNYDGDVYASDESRMLAEMGDKKFRLGNVIDDSYEAIFGSDTLLDILEETTLESVPICSECAFKPYCGADPNYHYATQKDIVGNKATSGFCRKNMEIFRHLITLLEDNSEARRILFSWLT